MSDSVVLLLLYCTFYLCSVQMMRIHNNYNQIGL